MRIGNGYDIHKLVEGRKLILGGVDIPHSKGLEGHSDADSLTHAVIDALLGAAALGDIGQHFPPGDERFKGADSLKMLTHVRNLLFDLGYEVVNVDSVIVCELPKLAPHIQKMRECLAAALSIDNDLISVKATTNEKLGPVGRGEGIAAYAVALITKI